MSVGYWLLECCTYETKRIPVLLLRTYMPNELVVLRFEQRVCGYVLYREGRGMLFLFWIVRPCGYFLRVLLLVG